MLNFAWPYLFLCLPLPLLMRRWRTRLQASPHSGLHLPDVTLVESFLLQNPQKSSSKVLSVLALCFWGLLVLSAARPLWVGDPVEMPVSGRDMMLAVDISPSMEMEDFQIQAQPVNRLVATKVIVRDFLKSRQGDRLGLILFGSRPYLQSPLSFDLKTLEQLLLEAQTGLAGDKTSLGDAIGLAVKHLHKLEESERVLILITDGANTAGELDPLEAAQVAKEQDVTIYTIGVGGGEHLRSTFFGMRSVNPATDLDEDTLRQIAEHTGGRYFRAQNTETLLEIADVLHRLEPVSSERETFRPTRELFHWPLGAAFFLGTVVFLLFQRHREVR